MASVEAASKYNDPSWRVSLQGKFAQLYEMPPPNFKKFSDIPSFYSVSIWLVFTRRPLTIGDSHVYSILLSIFTSLINDCLCEVHKQFANNSLRAACVVITNTSLSGLALSTKS